MSVDTIHPLLAGVFALVWLLVWQILVRSQRTNETENEEPASRSRSRLRRPYASSAGRSLRETSQPPIR